MTPEMEAALVFLTTDTQVLLARKKATAKIGANTLNGYGGMVEEEDSGNLVKTAQRELLEESGLHAAREDFSLVAVIDFHTQKDDGTTFTVRVHTFLLKKWEGEILETPEMLNPQWYSLTNLPLTEMMPADQFWLPHILAGKIIRAQVYYSPKQQSLLQPCEIQDVPRESLVLDYSPV